MARVVSRLEIGICSL